MFGVVKSNGWLTLRRFVVVLFLLAVAVTAGLAAPGNVLRTQKISDTVGGLKGDPDPGDWFGYSVTSLGDLDGDGNGDIAVGAPLRDDGDGNDSGAVWILFLDAGGRVLAEQKISEVTGNFDASLDPGDEFGASVAAIGDVNGDGIVDLAVGAPGDDDGGGSNSGAVWIIFLAEDGTVIESQKISDAEGGLQENLVEGDAFGIGVGALGDFDGDDVPDLLVGAPLDDDGDGLDVGALYILLLREDGSVRDEVKISETLGDFMGELHDGDWFGHGVAAIGDVDGDGTVDLAVGAPLDDDGGESDSGAVWLVFLAKDGTVKGQQKISDDAGGLLEFVNLSPEDLFGYSVSAAGDIDGDGVVDVFVGAPFDDDGGGDDVGAAWFVMLNPDGTVKNVSKISETAGGFDGSLSAVDTFGSAVAVIDDLDGDGVPDAAVGAPLDDDGGGSNSGAVWILFLDGLRPGCGDASGDLQVTAIDAQISLAASVGLATCELCNCDVDGSATITASDALRILNKSVGLPVELVCPPCA
jgi:hypothetical protein